MHALARYVLPKDRELHMIFQFELMDIDSSGKTRANPLQPREWKLSEFKEVINRWQTFLRDDGFWNRYVSDRFPVVLVIVTDHTCLYSVYIQNHDQARCVSRFASDTPQWRSISAKMLAILEITQTGTLYVYQGEEIAMANAPSSWPIEEYKDVATLNYYRR